MPEREGRKLDKVEGSIEAAASNLSLTLWRAWCPSEPRDFLPGEEASPCLPAPCCVLLSLSAEEARIPQAFSKAAIWASQHSLEDASVAAVGSQHGSWGSGGWAHERPVPFHPSPGYFLHTQSQRPWNSELWFRSLHFNKTLDPENLVFGKICKGDTPKCDDKGGV